MAEEQDATLYANRTAATMTGSEYLLAAESDALNAAGLNIPVDLFIRNGVNGGDGIKGVVAGATRAVRFNVTATQMALEGVDNTGAISFQPLAIGGSYVAITESGTERARFTGGNLALGATNPTAKLDVRGGADIGGAGTDGEIGIVRSAGQRVGSLGWSTALNTLQIKHQNGGNIQFFRNDVLQCEANISNAWLPGSDAGQSLGLGARRWGVVYSSTGTINTSDEREKNWLQTGITGSNSNRISDKIDYDAFYRAGLEIRDEFGFYQWLDAIGEKGEDSARIHFGPRAQRVFSILEKNGIDPARIAFCCYDKWEEDREPIFKTVTKKVKEKQPNPKFDPRKKVSPRNKKTVTVAVDFEEQVDTGKSRVTLEAGDRYGLRLDMLNAFMGSVRDRRQDELEKRLEALEQ